MPGSCDGSAPSVPSLLGRRLGLAAVLALSTLYILLWWNRYLSPVNGGELHIAMEFEHGRMPYRDYYYFTQPGNVIQCAAVTALFGHRLIVFWALGVALRVASLGCLYLWLLRVSRPSFAALAVITTGIIAAADVCDHPSFYNHQALAHGVIGAFFASKALEARGRAGVGWALLAGLFLAFNLLIKQTTGLVIAAAVTGGLAVGAWRLHGAKQAALRLAALLLALAVPMGLVWLWLDQHGVLGSYFDQVYFSASKSKGGLGATLLRPLILTFIFGELFWSWFVGLAGLGLLGLGWIIADRKALHGQSQPVLVVLLVAFGALVTLTLRPWDNPNLGSRVPLLAAVYVTLIGNLIVMCSALPALRNPEASATQVQEGFLGLIGFAAAYSLSVSWAAFEIMVFPGLAVVLALGLEKSAGLRVPTRLSLVGVCLVLVVLAGWRKFTTPCSWGGWQEPPLSASTQSPTTPQLQGFVLSPATAKMFDDITAMIREHSSENETVLVYPHMHIFYGLADRQPATLAFHHWVDAVTDEVAEADAERILKNPPAVIVALQLPPETYWAQELAFRGGKPSGQRKLAAAIESLTRNYEQLGVFHSDAPSFPIAVWARRRAPAGPSGEVSQRRSGD